MSTHPDPQNTISGFFQNCIIYLCMCVKIECVKMYCMRSIGPTNLKPQGLIFERFLRISLN